MKNKDSYEMTDNPTYASIGKLEHHADVTSTRDESYAVKSTSCRSQKYCYFCLLFLFVFAVLVIFGAMSTLFYYQLKMASEISQLKNAISREIIFSGSSGSIIIKIFSYLLVAFVIA